jgi:hypothetical protein
MANQNVGTPRFYVDFTQLAKIKGDYLWGEEYPDTDETLSFEGQGESPTGVWDFDLYDTNSFDTTVDLASWNFYINQESSMANLVSLSNWFGIFNHKLASNLSSSSGVAPSISFVPAEQTASPIYPGNFSNTYNFDYFEKNGYSLAEFENPTSGMSIEYVALVFIVDSLNSEGALANKTLEIGSFGFGRYYDMPQSPDLSVKKSIEYEGVKIQRTLGGGDYVQIDNFGTPDWISGEPWVLVHPDESSSRIARHGRRSWQLSFSYISNDDLFFDTNRLNSFGDLDFVQGTTDNILSAGTEIQQIFDLTMSGGLSFIFTPDKDATNPEFAQCRIDQNSLSATQVAYQTWNISMNIVEVW